MKKSLEQPKNKTKTMEMARQTLGRVKEMDLSPEEKEKVMAMIDKAIAEEKAGNKSKALNLYLELRKHLEHLKAKDKGEIIDDPEITKRQLRLIDAQTIKLTNMLISSTGVKEENLQRVDALQAQRKQVLKSTEMKTRYIPAEQHNYVPEVLKEKDIWDLIKNQEKFPEGALFLDDKGLDEDGHLVYLDLHVAGKPEIGFRIHLSEIFEDTKGKKDVTDTVIIKYEVNLQDKRKRQIREMAKYNMKLHMWEILD